MSKIYRAVTLNSKLILSGFSDRVTVKDISIATGVDNLVQQDVNLKDSYEFCCNKFLQIKSDKYIGVTLQNIQIKTKYFVVLLDELTPVKIKSLTEDEDTVVSIIRA